MAASKTSLNYDEKLLSFVQGQPLELNNVVHTKTSLEFKPKTKYNVGYIVAAVIFNEKNEVLLIQEAKQSCRGLWYLPAGRVEAGESLQKGVQREVEEESGHQFKPVTLVTVEVQSTSWYRFTFTGHITGGELKTIAEADGESLQAAWFPFNLVVNPQMGSLHLRAHDIIPLVQKTKLYQMSQVAQKKYYNPSLPLLVHHDSLILRLLMVCPCEGREEGAEESLWSKLWYLRHTSKKSLILPATMIKLCGGSLEAVARQLIEGELSSRLKGRICGIIHLEYQGAAWPEQADGICINALYVVEAKGAPHPPHVKNTQYVWQEASQSELQDLLNAKLQEMGTVALLGL